MKIQKNSIETQCTRIDSFKKIQNDAKSKQRQNTSVSVRSPRATLN